MSGTVFILARTSESDDSLCRLVDSWRRCCVCQNNHAIVVHASLELRLPEDYSVPTRVLDTFVVKYIILICCGDDDRVSTRQSFLEGHVI